MSIDGLSVGTTGESHVAVVDEAGEDVVRVRRHDEVADRRAHLPCDPTDSTLPKLPVGTLNVTGSANVSAAVT
jgi:hypothetical protein